MDGRFSGAAGRAARTAPKGLSPVVAIGQMVVGLLVAAMQVVAAFGTERTGKLFVVLDFLFLAALMWLMGYRSRHAHVMPRRPRGEVVALAALAFTMIAAMLVVWTLPDEPLLPRTLWLIVPAGLLVALPFIVWSVRDLLAIRRAR